MTADSLAATLDRGTRETVAIDAAYARGELDDAGWHAANAARIVPAYLAAATPQGGSGHSGTADDWDYSRGIVADAIDRAGTFLDVGCANGLVMESVARWSRVEPYGLDIAPELAALARTRYPQWADRIAVGNALEYRPAQRFDFVRTGLEYVPPPQRRALVAHLLEHVGRRVIVGKYNELVADRAIERLLAGFAIAGVSERPHRLDPRVCYRVLWIDSV
ncbi:MAG TPA: class I SAM-dependent methyltransferase [Kofleriaceae bacterium]|jgi:2-polyprenyl-3-methyl-5-hydroxy-6-metoxy-1,4-benzoquinol methylase